MKTRKFIPALGAFFVLVAMAISGCGSSIPGNSVAVVAGNPISLQAFNHWLYVDAKSQAASSPGQPVIAPNDPPQFTRCIAQARAEFPTLKTKSAATLRSDCKQLFTSLSSQVMDFLIKAYWYQGTAHQLGIKLTDAQIAAALTKAKAGQFKTDAQFQTFLKGLGETQQDVDYRLRVSQIFTKLVARHSTPVTPAKIAAYYAAHKAQFGTPQTRNMRIVLAKTAAQAAAARSALQKGQSWTVVAKKYSTDPTTKNKGGALTNVTAGQQDAALSTAAFAAPVNKLLGPIKGQFGYYVLEVTKITPATQRSLATSTPLIKQTLTGQLQQAASTAVDNAAKKAWLSKTTCRPEYAMADCKGYKAPKTSTSAAPSTGATAPAPSSGATAPSSGATAPAPSATVTASSSATSTSSK
jgi:foldase protein PrsA